MSNKYGNDLMVFDGDLVISARSDLASSTDYEKGQDAPFEGYYNIIFSVFNRLNTVKGELPIHQDYGSNLPILVSSPNSPITAQAIRNEFQTVLLDDPRIAQVNLINIEQIDNKIGVTAEVVLTGKSDSSIFIFPNFYIE